MIVIPREGDLPKGLFPNAPRFDVFEQRIAEEQLNHECFVELGQNWYRFKDPNYTIDFHAPFWKDGVMPEFYVVHHDKPWWRLEY